MAKRKKLRDGETALRKRIETIFERHTKGGSPIPAQDRLLEKVLTQVYLWRSSLRKGEGQP